MQKKTYANMPPWRSEVVVTAMVTIILSNATSHASRTVGTLLRQGLNIQVFIRYIDTFDIPLMTVRKYDEIQFFIFCALLCTHVNIKKIQA